MEYVWKYGENDNQKYYECYIGKDYLCVVANNWNPDIWFCIYEKQGIGTVTVMDRVYNRKMMKKYNVSEAEAPLHGCQLLSGKKDDIEYLKRKLIHCYKNGKRMVTP